MSILAGGSLEVPLLLWADLPDFVILLLSVFLLVFSLLNSAAWGHFREEVLCHKTSWRWIFWLLLWALGVQGIAAGSLRELVHTRAWGINGLLLAVGHRWSGGAVASFRPEEAALGKDAHEIPHLGPLPKLLSTKEALWSTCCPRAARGCSVALQFVL